MGNWELKVRSGRGWEVLSTHTSHREAVEARELDRHYWGEDDPAPASDYKVELA